MMNELMFGTTFCEQQVQLATRSRALTKHSRELYLTIYSEFEEDR